LGLIAAAGLALVSCKSAAPSPAATAPVQATLASAPASGTTGTVIRIGESYRPESGPAALKAFVADVPAQEKGGECQVTRTGGSGATVVAAFYPARVGQQSQLSLTFDSVGHLIRYSEFRGMPAPITGARGLSPAQLDSAVREREARNRSTVISLDYGADRATAMNRGGGRPPTAIIGTVREIERLDQLGPPSARLERMRKLCGV
jgi:hypothetical protein